MNKIKVVYWSSTGNTEAMAEAIARGIESTANLAETKVTCLIVHFVPLY